MFTGAALNRLLGLSWLQRQPLVVHGATFEYGPLRYHRTRNNLPLITAKVDRVECLCPPARFDALEASKSSLVYSSPRHLRLVIPAGTMYK